MVERVTVGFDCGKCAEKSKTVGGDCRYNTQECRLDGPWRKDGNFRGESEGSQQSAGRV